MSEQPAISDPINRQTKPAIVRSAQLVLLDIEGTIGAQSFVKEVLFPYASAHLRDFVQHHADSAEVQQVLADTVNLARQLAAPAQRDAPIDPVQELLHWIAEDRKASPLKKLQGLIWLRGFESGAFQGHLYADAIVALQRWHAAGLSLAIYSSGSVASQHLYFGHSVAGNLLPLFSGHFDTDVGAKSDPQAYARIAALTHTAAADILFLSDAPAELEAAQNAGLQVVHVVRETTPPAPRFVSVTDFSQLTLTAALTTSLAH